MFIAIRSSGLEISGDWGRCQLLENVLMQSATYFRPILTEFRFSRQIFINVPMYQIQRKFVQGESFVQFRYLEITLTNQNSIREEMKSRLESGSTC